MDYNIVKDLIEKEIMIFSKKVLPHFDSNVYALEKIGQLDKKCKFLEYKIDNIKELIKNDINLISDLEKQIKEISLKIKKNDNFENEKKIMNEIKKIKHIIEKKNDKISIINEEIKKIENLKIKDNINEQKLFLFNEKFVNKNIFLKTKNFFNEKINNNFITINKKFEVFKKSFFKKIEKDIDENQKEIINKILKISDVLQI